MTAPAHPPLSRAFLSPASINDLQYSVLERSAARMQGWSNTRPKFLQLLILVIHAETGSGSEDVEVEAI